MIDSLVKLLFDLAHIPGLGFLLGYHDQIVRKRGRIEQKIGDLEAQRDAAIKGAKSAKEFPKNVKGSKKRA